MTASLVHPALRGRAARVHGHGWRRDRRSRTRTWLRLSGAGISGPLLPGRIVLNFAGMFLTAGQDARPRGDVPTAKLVGWYRRHIPADSLAFRPGPWARDSSPLGLSPGLGSAERETIEQFSRTIMNQFQFEPDVRPQAVAAIRPCSRTALSSRKLETVAALMPARGPEGC